MARPFVGSGALATSLIAHALLLACGALLISQSLRTRSGAQLAHVTPAGEIEVELPSFDPDRVLSSICDPSLVVPLGNLVELIDEAVTK